jgi:hypothetical protein
MNRVNLPAVWRIAWNTLPGEYILFPVVRARSNRVHFFFGVFGPNFDKVLYFL